MKTRLQYEDEKSRKFWEIELQGNCYSIHYGRLGTPGQSRSKPFPSTTAARKAYDEQIAAKIKKGYTLTGRPKTQAGAQSPAAKKTAGAHAKSVAEGKLSKSRILNALEKARNAPSPCIQMLLKYQKADARNRGSGPGPGFAGVTFKDFKARLGKLPEEVSLPEALSDDRHKQTDDPLHSFDYRNLLEAEILKGFFRVGKDKRDERAKVIKLVNKTRVVRGDFHVDQLVIGDYGFLIVTGSLFVGGLSNWPETNLVSWYLEMWK